VTGRRVSFSGSGIFDTPDVSAPGFFGHQPFGQGLVQAKEMDYPVGVVGKEFFVGDFYGLV
jgi:hypothetical protein